MCKRLQELLGCKSPADATRDPPGNFPEVAAFPIGSSEPRTLLGSNMSRDDKAKTGIEGLDGILAGGLSRGHVFLVEGAPGAGKTTIAMQFLMAGAEEGERCLYITLSETEAELRDSAASHGWEFPPQIEVFELVSPDTILDAEQHQCLLYSSDLELGEATKQIFSAVERVKPKCIVLDSLSEIRLLAQR